MRTIFIFLLIINVIVISVGEDPESAPVTDQSENPASSLEKGVEGLVNIVHSFLKNVQSEDFVGKESGSISFSEVKKIITDSKFEEFNRRWKDLVAVFGGFAACIVIGLLFMLCMPVAGCVTCCCFCCCKRCGKASSKEDPKHAKCKRITFGTLLFIFAILMLIGAIFAVISNEILHSKLQNVNEKGPVGEIKSGVEGLLDFAQSTADDVDDKANKKVDETVGTLLRTIRDATRQVVTDIKNTINATQLLNQLEALGKNANSSADSLSDVSEEVDRLRSLGNNVTNMTTSINASLVAACTGLPDNICPDTTGLSLGPSFSGLNNLSSIHVIVQTVTDISAKARNASRQFTEVQNAIEDKVNSTIKDAEKSTQKIKEDIIKELPNLKDALRNMTTSFNVTNKLNDVDKSLKEYGDYVWYVFVGIPCLILLVVLFYLFGLLFGMFGERPGPGASCCNKGAGSNMFCCGVTCSYLVSSILMLVVIIMFIPFGLLYTNGCQYLNDGVENIERFEFVINESLGYNIAAYIDKDKKSPNITVGSILSNCKKNEGVYDAFHLENLFSIDSILNVSHINKQIDDIAFKGSSTNLGTISIIPDNLKTQLTEFSNSGVDEINFTQYDDILNVSLVQIDLSALHSQLLAAANDTDDLNKTDKAKAIRDEAGKVKDVQEELQKIELARRNLSIALDNLRNQQNLTIQVTELIASLEISQTNFNTKSSTILSASFNATSASLKTTLNKSISDIKTEIKTLGPCRDVYDNVQKLSDAFCVTLLDPLNSIWFGLGWGLAFFIPCIIFALLTASLYQREEPYDQSFHTTRKLLKKRNKDESESTFDNPNIDMYQGQGYDAYNGQGADNMPLTGMRNEHPGNRDHHRSSGGMPNHGYHSPDYPDHRSSGHPHADYHHGYSKDQSSPPPYNGHSYNDNVSGRAKMYQKPQY